MFYEPVRRGFAEFVGAFTLIFIGAGATLTFTKLFAAAFSQGAADTATGLALVGIALANGLAIGVMVSAVGHISGGHFNPAITFGFLITRRLAPMLALVYWLARSARSSCRTTGRSVGSGTPDPSWGVPLPHSATSGCTCGSDRCLWAHRTPA